MSEAHTGHKSGRLRLKERKRDDHGRESKRRKSRHGRENSVEALRDGHHLGSTAAAAGPSHHPIPYFGDDLLRAERYEAELKEKRSWSNKLNDLLQDDLDTNHSEFGGARGGGGGPSSYMYEKSDDAAWREEMNQMKEQGLRESSSSEYNVDIPQKWKDAARGFDTRIGRGTAGLRDLDEEEYAEYIREGMYRRKHAKELAFEEERQRKWEEKQTRKRKEKDERREAKRRQKELDEKKVESEKLESARSNWESKWSNLLSKASDESVPVLTVSDIPWPSLDPQDISKSSIHYFLFHDSDKDIASKRFRTALLRYHPDRFLTSRFYLKISGDAEKAHTEARVAMVSQILSDIVEDRR